MSAGLGRLQRYLMKILGFLWDRNRRAQFKDIRAVLIYGRYARGGKSLSPSEERSAWRALQKLIARGEVLAVEGGTSGRREYANAEDILPWAAEAPKCFRTKFSREDIQAALRKRRRSG
jgi:hypothetical protein